MIVKARQLAGLDAAYIPAGTATACRSRTRSRRPTAAACRDDEVQAKSRAYATEQIDGHGGLQAPGRAGRLGPPYKHHGLRQRGGRDPRAQAPDRARFRLPRPQAGLLVLRLRFLAGRVRDRVRRQESPAVDVAFLCAEPCQAGRPSACPSSTRTPSRSSGRPRPGPSPPTRRSTSTPSCPTPGGGHRARPVRAWPRSLVECLARWQLGAAVVADHPARSSLAPDEVQAPAGARGPRLPTARARSTWPTTPPPTTAPASCTPRPPTAWTTSSPASHG